MPSKGRIARALSVVLPSGALGASLVLALSSAQARPAEQPAAEAPVTGSQSVSARLRAIREGVSELTTSQEAAGSAEPKAPADGKLTPTWWGNGGWGRWHMGWGNGGFGWPNWHNWHNWGNGGWHNWGNGWHNFWHNW